MLLGDPTANIPFDHVLWDVKNRGDESSGHTSFSENDHNAAAARRRFELGDILAEARGFHAKSGEQGNHEEDSAR